MPWNSLGRSFARNCSRLQRLNRFLHAAGQPVPALGLDHVHSRLTGGLNEVPPRLHHSLGHSHRRPSSRQRAGVEASTNLAQPRGCTAHRRVRLERQALLNVFASREDRGGFFAGDQLIRQAGQGFNIPRHSKSASNKASSYVKRETFCRLTVLLRPPGLHLWEKTKGGFIVCHKLPRGLGA